MEALIVSQVVSWIVIVALCATVLALVRQVGVLHERVAPLGALTTPTAVEIGDPAPEFDLVDLAGIPQHLGGTQADGRSQLLLFVSPDCPMCKKLLPTARSFARSERQGVRIVLIGDGEQRAHGAMVAEHKLEGLPLLLAPIVGITLGIGKLPHAVLIDAAGVIRAKGLVNSREHLESLLVAQETGYASMQDYLLGRHRHTRDRSAQEPPDHGAGNGIGRLSA
jgi:methylamine dehydrogenase accessory protein MauD